MALFEEIFQIIISSDHISYIIAILLFLCLLIGFLIIRKFYDIWRIEVEKGKAYRELIQRYENDPDSGDIDSEV